MPPRIVDGSTATDRPTAAPAPVRHVSLPTPQVAVADRSPRLWALWAASRPSQVALVLLVYLLGAGMALAGGPLAVESGATAGTVGTSAAGPLAPDVLSTIAVGAIALLPVTVSIHYANEYADVDTDALADRTPFSGGSGALVVTSLPRAFLGRALGASLVGSVVVMVAVLVTGALPGRAVGLLVAALLVGLAYSLQPIALIRRGVGEVVNATLGGILLPVYGVAVLAPPTHAAWLAVVPFALVVGCNLLAVHWPDREADAAVGKRTLAVRWSPLGLRRAYAVLAVAAVGSAAGLRHVGVFPDAVAAAHLAPLPFLVWGGAVLTRQRSPLPSVLAMAVLAGTATLAWWWVAVGA